MKNITNSDGIVIDVNDDCKDCKFWNKDKEYCIRPSYLRCPYE